MIVRETPPPTHLNIGEYWWCEDHDAALAPVLISAVKKKDGEFYVWYDYAGTDEGFDISGVKWYGRVEIPKIANQ